MRNTTNPVHPEVVVWVYSATACSALTLALPITASGFVVHASSQQWLCLLEVGMSSIIEQVLVTLGFKNVPASVGTLLLTMETGFAFLFGLVALGETAQWKTVLGACFIGAAVGFTARTQSSKPADV